MNDPLVPRMDVVLARVQPIVGALFRAIEVGTAAAQRYDWPKSEEGRPIICPFLASAVTRFEARRCLQERFDVSDEFSAELEDVSNNGICISFSNYQIRILKEAYGGLPGAGRSDRRARFYKQEQLSLLTGMVDATPEKIADLPLNLVILWAVDPRTYSLDRLTLACPKSDRPARRASGELDYAPECHFIVALPHPAESSEELRHDASDGDEIVRPKPDSGAIDDAQSDRG